MDNLAAACLAGKSSPEFDAVAKDLVQLVDSATAKLDALKLDECVALANTLDGSQLARTNILYSRVARRVAAHAIGALLESGVKPEEAVAQLDALYLRLGDTWHAGKRCPFAVAEGVRYAINKCKLAALPAPCHVHVSVPFFKEFERGHAFSAENLNGEEAAVQKAEEFLWLLRGDKHTAGFKAFHVSQATADVVFVNDSIAEKQDVNSKTGDSSVRVFKESLLAHMGTVADDDTRSVMTATRNDTAAAGDKAWGAALKHDEVFGFSFAGGQLRLYFTSVEGEAAKGSAHETPEEKTKRMENRDDGGKLRERKGGAVLAGMEVPLRAGVSPANAIRVLLDGDSAIAPGAFVGDAAHAILRTKQMSYLANLKHKHTLTSMLPSDKGDAQTPAGTPLSPAGTLDGTQKRVQNRKLFYSGFLVPLLFPEITRKYKYNGTTQVPAKAFRGDLDFAAGKLRTVQPNVDIGMLALLVTFLNGAPEETTAALHDPAIGSGPVTVRDNIESSTMTSADLTSEWRNTYGPIFTSIIGLCQQLKPEALEQQPKWCTAYIAGMTEEDYVVLFGDSVSSDVDDLFDHMKGFRDADEPKQAAVLDELHGKFKRVFGAKVQ